MRRGDWAGVALGGAWLWVLGTGLWSGYQARLASAEALASAEEIAGQARAALAVSVSPEPEALPLGLLQASWYGESHRGRLMASGAPFDPSAAVVAHRTLPLGTKLKLQDPASGRTAMATVADRGPYVAGRDLDLSQSLARTLGVEARGVASLQVWVVTDLLDRRWRDEKSRPLMP